MSFSKALYYPFIDIGDPAWLRTACLYWEEIQTIVPESLDSPYKTPDTQALEGEGLLIPLRVHPSMPELEALAGDVLAFLERPEGVEMLLPSGHGSATIHVEKLPYELEHVLRDKSIIIPEGSWEDAETVRRNRASLLRGEGRRRKDDGFLEIDGRFANFYMTLLASRLADRIGAGLLSPLASADRLATAARLDAITPNVLDRHLRRPREYDALRRHQEMPRTLAHGSLAHLAIQRLGVHEDTPIEDLLRFRRKHADELGRFRAELGRLTRETQEEDLSLEALQQRVVDIYENEVKPAVADLQAALKGSGIRSTTEGFLKAAFMSAAPTSALVMAGFSTPTALLAGAGISLAATVVLYNTNRAAMLRQNPYSYLLSVAREFG